MGDIRKLLYGLSIASFFIVSIMLFMAESNDKYDVDYNESDVEGYNRLQDINNISEDIRSNQDRTLNSNPLDVLGEFFKTGYSGVRLTTTSIDVADDMASDAITDANLGESGSNLKILAATLLVLFIMGTIIAIAVGRDW